MPEANERRTVVPAEAMSCLCRANWSTVEEAVVSRKLSCR